jgi:hypothetical protein
MEPCAELCMMGVALGAILWVLATGYIRLSGHLAQREYAAYYRWLRKGGR